MGVTGKQRIEMGIIADRGEGNPSCICYRNLIKVTISEL